MISVKIIINLKDVLKFEIFLYNDCYNINKNINKKIRYKNIRFLFEYLLKSSSFVL